MLYDHDFINDTLIGKIEFDLSNAVTFVGTDDQHAERLRGNMSKWRQHGLQAGKGAAFGLHVRQRSRDARAGEESAGAGLREAALRTELAAMNSSELKARARANGVKDYLLDATDDKDDPKAALVEVALGVEPPPELEPELEAEPEPEGEMWKQADGGHLEVSYGLRL